MKATKKYLFLPFFALLTLVGQSSSHAAPLTATNGDLLLGIEDASGTENMDLVINLGLYTNGVIPSSFTPVNISSDLSQVFGTNWASNASLNLQYGIYGFNRGNNTITMSQASTTPAGQSAQQLETSYANQNDTFGNLLVEYNSGVTATLSGGGTTTNGVFMLSADTSYWSSYAGINAGSVFDDSNINPIETSLGSSVDMYNNPLGSSSLLGTYLNYQMLLSSSGIISEVAAVPEPSTYLLLGVGGVMLLVVSRRRMAK